MWRNTTIGVDGVNVVGTLEYDEDLGHATVIVVFREPVSAIFRRIEGRTERHGRTWRITATEGEYPLVIEATSAQAALDNFAINAVRNARRTGS